MPTVGRSNQNIYAAYSIVRWKWWGTWCARVCVCACLPQSPLNTPGELWDKENKCYRWVEKTGLTLYTTGARPQLPCRNSIIDRPLNDAVVHRNLVFDNIMLYISKNICRFANVCNVCTYMYMLPSFNLLKTNNNLIKILFKIQGDSINIYIYIYLARDS